MAATSRAMPLGDVIRFGNGKAIKPGGEGCYRVYGSNGIIGGCDEFRYENGVIIGRVGAYCGSVAYCPEKFWASDNTLVAFPASDHFDTKFLFYLLTDAKLSRYAGGAAQPLVTQTVLKQVEVCVPPLPVQRRIAGILSAYDELMENNQRRIKILEEMARSLYREWFVNFRFPGHEKVPRVDSSLGKIPERWEVKSLGEMCAVVPGFAFKSQDWQESGVPVVKIKNIQSDNTVDINDTDFVSEEIAERTPPKFTLKHGEFLLAMTGATAGKIGRLRSRRPMLLNQRVAKILPHDGFGSFAWCAISSEEAKDRFFRLADGAAQPNMSGSQIERIMLTTPTMDVLNSFSKMTDAILIQSDNLYLKNLNLRRARDLLLPKLISGELTVCHVDTWREAYLA